MVETATENHACPPFHLFKPYVLYVSILVPSIVLTCFLGLGFYAILFTTTVLVSSTSFIVKFSQKTKVVLEDEVVQPVLVNDTVSDAVQGADDGVVNDFQVDGSLDLTSESESSEDGELNWMVSGNVEQNPENFDEYLTSEVDDEEDDGLIEIAIPSNDTTGLNEEPKQNVQSILPTFLPESIFQQQELVALLAEINEEENLIEIDISMGSIKCPAFGIEA